MKALFSVFTIIFCIAFQAHAVSVDLKCEEGVGNMSNPEQYLYIRGKLDLSTSGELSPAQKSQIRVQVVKNGKMIELSGENYQAHLTTGSYELELDVLTDEGRRITVSMESDIPQVFVRVIQGKTLFTRKDKVVGSGVCWGANPILVMDEE